MSDEKNNGNMRRRDFLAGVGIGALAAGMPMLPKAAIAASGMEAAPEGQKSHALVFTLPLASRGWVAARHGFLHLKCRAYHQPLKEGSRMATN